MTTSAPLLGEPLPVELMNTVWADRDGIRDSLADTTEASAWLEAIAGRADIGEVPPTIAAADLADLRALRDALRTIATEVTRERRDVPTAEAQLAAAIAAVNRAARAEPGWPALGWSRGPVRREAPAEVAVAALITRVAAGMVALVTDEGHRLRACPAPGCVLFFVKSHPRREWCSPACGNRARVARHYRRHRAPA